MAIYRVQTRAFGELLKTEDNIRAARLWARRAFPGESCAVSRLVNVRAFGCKCCGLRPCIKRRGLFRRA